VTKSNLDLLKEISIKHLNQFGDDFIDYVRSHLKSPFVMVGIRSRSKTVAFIVDSKDKGSFGYVLHKGTKEFDEYIEVIQALLEVDQL